MAPYNVMITQANSKMSIVFVRQLLSLPHPPEYIFATYTAKENLKDLIDIEKWSKNSQVIPCELDLKRLVEDGTAEVMTIIKKIIGNRGLDLLINITALTNDGTDLVTSLGLENQFQASTLPSLMLFQIMLPLLEAAALRNREYNLESNVVFFNITEDYSGGSNPVSEINKVALDLAMSVLAQKVKNDNILVLSTCISLQQDDELEESVTSNLLYVLCSSQIENSATSDNSTVYKS